MQRRTFLAAAAAAALAPTSAALGAPKLPRIGFLSPHRPAGAAYFLEAFHSGLTDRGYVIGRNLVIEHRYADDDAPRVPELAAELVRLRVDLIVAHSAAVRVVSKLGLPIPVVFSFSSDPVSSGVVDSLAKPGRAMTGVTLMAAELNYKRLELARDIIPDIRRVALLGNPLHPGEHLERSVTNAVGQALGFAVDYYPTRNKDELAAALAAVAETAPQAISVLSDGFAVQNRKAIIDFAMNRRVAVVSGWPIFAESGALLTFGPNLREVYRRVAYFADRILKGAKAADLPVERPTKFELVVNLKTATALGLSVPMTVLAAADQVIESVS